MCPLCVDFPDERLGPVTLPSDLGLAGSAHRLNSGVGCSASPYRVSATGRVLDPGTILGLTSSGWFRPVPTLHPACGPRGGPAPVVQLGAGHRLTGPWVDCRQGTLLHGP